MFIRKYRSSDCEEIAKLFYDTVHNVNIQDYSAEQVSAWADGSIDLAAWDRSFLEHYTVIAEENGIIIGFGDISDDGYLDRLYVHKDYQRKGVATAICDALVIYPNSDELTVHASITAKMFFVSRGYAVVKEQQVMRRGGFNKLYNGNL
ncbi:MAG: GNAT family N-acetyltransferase [Oscillospiraceae bacterium]